MDSHTGGEPTRLVLDGFPDLGTGDMESRRKILSEKYDHFRTATMLEPRGNDVLVGALLCKPVNPKASAGIIFFNNAGYLGMCGHGTIGLVASLAYLGKIQIGTHLIETPVGDVEATLHEDYSVSVRNVPAYRYQKAVELDIPAFGKVKGDIAWGGNWFFLINDHGQRVSSDNLDQLTEYAWAVRQALSAQGITGKDGQEIDHIELFGANSEADSKTLSSVQVRPMTVHHVVLAPAPKWHVWLPMVSFNQVYCGSRPVLLAVNLRHLMNRPGNM